MTLKKVFENTNLQYIKTIFISFGQNTAEFYDKYSLLTVLYIFWPEFGLKPYDFALHLTDTIFGRIAKQFRLMDWWCLSVRPSVDIWLTFALKFWNLLCNPAILRYNIILTVSIARWGIKLQCEGDLISKGEQCFKKKFCLLLNVMQNSVVLT